MIRVLSRLVRPRVALLASLGTFSGCLLARPGPEPGSFFVAAGAFLLACGCSALNQVQERSLDGRMARTRTRPLPCGDLAVGRALALALALLAGGLALLARWGGPPAALVALAVAALYNGIYTPLKTRTAFSLLAGGLAGAAPPLLGFAAAGGRLDDPRILAVALVFYLWQVPHVLLLDRAHHGDGRAAGVRLPDSAEAPPGPPLRAWYWSYCVALLLVPAFGLIPDPPVRWGLAALALALAGLTRPVLGKPKLGFALVNASLLLFLAGLSFGALRAFAVPSP